MNWPQLQQIILDYLWYQPLSKLIDGHQYCWAEQWWLFLGDCREQAGGSCFIHYGSSKSFPVAINGGRITDSLWPVWVNDLIIWNNDIIISSQEEAGVTPRYYSHLLPWNSLNSLRRQKSSQWPLDLPHSIRLEEENKWNNHHLSKWLGCYSL